VLNQKGGFGKTTIAINIAAAAFAEAGKRVLLVERPRLVGRTGCPGASTSRIVSRELSPPGPYGPRTCARRVCSGASCQSVPGEPIVFDFMQPSRRPTAVQWPLEEARAETQLLNR
jgi:hypothetical protein